MISLSELVCAGSREEWGDGLHPLQVCFGVVNFLVSLHQRWSNWSVEACIEFFQVVLAANLIRNARFTGEVRQSLEIIKNLFQVAIRCGSEIVAGCRSSHPWAWVAWCWMLQKRLSSWVPWLLHCLIVAGLSWLIISFDSLLEWKSRCVRSFFHCS